MIDTARNVEMFGTTKKQGREIPVYDMANGTPESRRNEASLLPLLDALVNLLGQQLQQPPAAPKSDASTEFEPVSGEKSYMAQLREKKMLTKQEAAYYIGIHERTLTHIMNAGDFYPLVRIGHNRGKVFVNREKLDQWLNEQDGEYKALPYCRA